MIRVRSKLVRRLTADEVNQCRKLTFGYRGAMESALLSFRARRDIPARAIMLYDDEDPTKIIAWSLLMYDTALVPQPQTAQQRRQRVVARCVLEIKDPYAYFYVAKQYRRQGLGSKLIAHTRRFERDVRVCPSNRANRAFFARFEMPLYPGYRY